MKNWQDYATNANTNQSQLHPSHNQSISPAQSTKTNTLQRVWLHFNIALTVFCAVVVLILLINIVAIIMHTNNTLPNILSSSPGNISTLLLFPAYFYIVSTSTIPSELPMIKFLIITFIFLFSIFLFVNATCALIYFLKNHKNYPRQATRNLVFATIPLVFTITALLVIYCFI